jgi:anti-sigma regulatory factor (Ser/Thr protein kinase)
MSETKRPATLRVFRYEAAGSTLRSIIGDEVLPLSRDELVKLARDAMAQRTFVVHAVPGSGQADELCFIPSDDRCEILSIHSNGWRRHYGDHRRSLMQILNDLAAAVACSRLRLLDDRELRVELDRAEPSLSFAITDSATLAEARTRLGDAIELLGISGARRDETVLCASEAATNTLVHGGGGGTVSLVPFDDRVRLVVADSGPGLNFLNWLENPSTRAQASMGYGYKIILDHIDRVCLHTGTSGTTLILDQLT